MDRVGGELEGNKIEVVEYEGLRKGSHARRRSVRPVIGARLKDSCWEAKLGGKVFKSFY